MLLSWFYTLFLLLVVPTVLAQQLVIEANQLHLHPVSQTAVFSGAVSATHQQLQLQAATVTLELDDAQQLQALVATDDVRLQRGTDIATGDKLTYIPTSQQVELTGAVTLIRNQTTLRGGRLVYNLATGDLNLEQTGPQRVRAEVNNNESQSSSEQ